MLHSSLHWPQGTLPSRWTQPATLPSSKATELLIFQIILQIHMPAFYSTDSNSRWIILIPKKKKNTKQKGRSILDFWKEKNHTQWKIKERGYPGLLNLILHLMLFIVPSFKMFLPFFAICKLLLPPQDPSQTNISSKKYWLIPSILML